MKVLLIFLIMVSGINLVYGELPFIDAIVDQKTCEKLDGKIINYFINDEKTQEVKLCEYNERHFRIANLDACSLAVGTGIDPDSGTSYEFPHFCQIPESCNSNYDWGQIWWNTFIYKLSVTYEKQYDIVLVSPGCISEMFFPDEKKIRIEVTRLQPDKYDDRFFAMIPKDLLSGDFQVILDGSEIKYNNIQSTDAEYYLGIAEIPVQSNLSEKYTMIYFDLEHVKSKSVVEIIGTNVIPEFSNVGLIIFITIFLTIMISIFSKPIRLFIHN